MKTFSGDITEASRRAQRASKSGRKPKEGPRSEGDDKPSAVVTVGLPGSGKSTIAKHMVSKGNTDQHELDKSRQALGKGPAYFGQDIVQHTYSGAKKSAEQGRSTVLSNTSIPRQHRQDAIQRLKDSGYENVKAVLSPGSTKAAMRRNRKRTGSKPGEGAVPQFVMNRMAKGMQQMSRDERRELRSNYKELHKKERFTKPAMKRSGVIREAKIDDYQKLSPIEKEFVRHKRQTGFEPGSDIDKHTETRRLVHRERRGAKKREPYRDGSSKYASKSQNQKKLKELQGKKTLRSASNNIRDFERSTKTFEQFIDEARRMRVLRTAHYNTASAVRDIHDTGFRQGTRSDGAYHDKGMNVLYTTPSSRVGSDYGYRRVNFKLVNPQVTTIDSPKNYGKRLKDWMRNSSDDDLVNDRNRPKDSFKQSREAIRGGSKVIRIPDAHGGHDEPKKGNRGSYIILDKDVANKSIDRNPRPTIKSTGKRRKIKTLREFLELAERYYEPDEELPGSKKTPYQKAFNKERRREHNIGPNSNIDRMRRHAHATETKVKHGADNLQYNGKVSPRDRDITVDSDYDYMTVHHKPSKITYNVTNVGDGIHTIEWQHGHGDKKNLSRRQRLKIASDAKNVWNQHVAHRLPYGDIAHNKPSISRDEKTKQEKSINRRANIYQRSGFGPTDADNDQFARIGREPSSRQKARGKSRLKPEDPKKIKDEVGWDN